MKLKPFFALPIVALCLVACSDNEDQPTLTEFAGTYEGYTLAGCAYFQNSCTTDESISITENTDGSANITFISEQWGEFSILNAQVSKNDGTYTLSGNGITKMGMDGNTSAYDCSYTATINSLNNAQMQFKAPSVMGGLTIDFITGEAPVNLLLPGTYKGYTDADCAYFQDRYTNDESLKIIANEDGSIAITFESDTWGTFNVAKATITRNDNQYIFSGEGTVSMGMGNNQTDYSFTMTGTTNAKKDNYSFTFNTPAVMGGLTITLLPGTAPSVIEQ